MRNLAIFASGGGSNAEAIVLHFNRIPSVQVRCIVSNKPKAGVLQRAQRLGIETIIINREIFYDTDELIEALRSREIDFIALAGFLWLIPSNLITAYGRKMVNIHPALLPKYGGKGMYGIYVHEAVINNKESMSGMTVHMVTEAYDAGAIIFQANCPVFDTDTPNDLAQRVLKLEHTFYPLVLEGLLKR